MTLQPKPKAKVRAAQAKKEPIVLRKMQVLPQDIIRGTLAYIYGKRLTKKYWRSLAPSYGWTEVTIAKEVASNKIGHKKLKKELETMQVFPIGEVNSAGGGDIGRCLPNTISAHRYDKENKIYQGYIISKVSCATRESGEPRYTVTDHFFNVKNGTVQEYTSIDREGDIFYVGVPVTLEYAMKERKSDRWK